MEDEAFHARMKLELAQLGLVGAILEARRAGEPLDQPRLRALARQVLDLTAAYRETTS